MWWRVGPALIVSLALQVGVNYSNDYSDGIRGTDDVARRSSTACGRWSRPNRVT